MVDEARDSSVKEHMRVVLRYVNKKKSVIERFLAVVHVPDTSSHSLKMAIDALFVQHGLSLSRLRGQGYDGASNMRGEFNGLKSLILQENPFAMYVHCFSHQLQLVLVAVAHDNFTVVDLIIQEMNNRFSEVSTELLGCISCLHPRNSFSQFDVDKLIHLVDFYPEDFYGTDYLFLEQQLMSYFYNLRDDPYFSSIDDLGILAQKLVETEKHLVFPLVYRMIELTLVLPVATASIERVFSAMKTVKTDLRNRMRDEWMNDSLVVYIEKDIFSTIENEQILQHFQQMQSHRI
ncbi:uncharacterized protein LOC122035840 [Zingiber officinale]|uniref:uncharacterized protein LOC122035840 n=1 Tax=Zingiber officinale TaxID=94328 RepID=UPI001C4C7F7D|nr:uncharacterized protein LOC122035840 [Zingiber officinale]